MLIYKKFGLRIGEAWFNEPIGENRADILFYQQANAPIAGAANTAVSTLVIDLQQDEKLLLSNLNSNTRYEVRRAREKDGLLCFAWDKKEAGVLDRFRSVYEVFAQQKGLAPVGSSRLLHLSETGNLEVSWSARADGEALVYHVYLAVANRARLLYSASLFRASSDAEFRNLVGRANRLLHWEDMLRFRAAGVKTYDFGGWYAGKEDAEKLRINSFKEGFGGKMEQYWNAEQLLTARAKLAKKVQWAMKLLRFR